MRSKKLSEEQKGIIIEARKKGISFSQIAAVLDLPVTRLTTFHSRYVATQNLPPRVQITNRLTDGRVGLQIKSMLANQEFKSVRKAPGQLSALLAPGTPIPSKSSVHRFLKDNNFKNFNLKKNH